MDIKSNYDKQADKCRKEFINMDHQKIAEKFNLQSDENYLYIYFFNQKYRLNKHNGDVEKTEDDKNYVKAKFNEIMTFLDLFAYSKENLKLSGKLRGVTSLKGVIQTGSRITHTDFFQKDAKKFSGKTEKLIKACQALKGRKINKGDVGYEIDVFDFFPITFIFYEEDSEFPAECSFLWDENTLDYMHYETTFYVAKYLLERLYELIKVF